MREPEEMRLLSGAGETALLKDIPWRLDSSSLESFSSILPYRSVQYRGVRQGCDPVREAKGKKRGSSHESQTGEGAEEKTSNTQGTKRR